MSIICQNPEDLTQADVVLGTDCEAAAARLWDINDKQTFEPHDGVKLFSWVAPRGRHFKGLAHSIAKYEGKKAIVLAFEKGGRSLDVMVDIGAGSACRVLWPAAAARKISSKALTHGIITKTGKDTAIWEKKCGSPPCDLIAGHEGPHQVRIKPRPDAYAEACRSHLCQAPNGPLRCAKFLDHDGDHKAVSGETWRQTGNVISHEAPETPQITEATDSNGRMIKVGDRVRVLQDITLPGDHLAIGEHDVVDRFVYACGMRYAALNGLENFWPTRSLVLAPIPRVFPALMPSDEKRMKEIARLRGEIQDITEKRMSAISSFNEQLDMLTRLLREAQDGDPNKACPF